MSMKNDAPMNWGMTFQDTGSVMGEGMVSLHNMMMMYMMMMLMVVLWMTMMTMMSYKGNKMMEKYSNHSVMMEMMWTMMPTMMMMGMLGPSFSLLYLMDEVMEPMMTVKYTGHQWYWGMEYTDNKGGGGMESYMMGEEELEEGSLSLLEVDNSVSLPMETEMSMMVTSGDVMHSLGMPSLGMKMDALPGSLNQTALYMLSEGVYYGGCYELCGALHSMMPTVMEGVKLEEFMLYMKEWE